MNKKAIISISLSFFIAFSTCTNLSTIKANANEINNEESKSDDLSIPTLHINIDESKGSINDMDGDWEHNTSCYGNVSINIPSEYKSPYGGTTLNNDTFSDITIKGRGNTSWHTVQKPYSIKLSDSQDLFGMGKSKKWVLVSNFFDKSLIRNRIAYDFANKIGMQYTPKGISVDVVMNDKYIGNYFLCQKIDVKKSMVDIDDLDDSVDATDSETISGGYLLELDSRASEEPVWFETSNETPFTIQSPSFEDKKNNTQLDYIKSYTQNMEDAILSDNYYNSKNQCYSDLIDVDSFVDYYLVNELFKNADAMYSSSYFYKPRNEKMFKGPIWDFDLSMGTYEYLNTEDPEGWYVNQVRYLDDMRMDYENGRKNEYYPKLMSDPEFVKKVIERWNDIYEKVGDITKDNGVIDKYVTELKTSEKSQADKYGFPIGMGRLVMSQGSYDKEISYLRNWLNTRREWINNNINSLMPKHYTVKVSKENGQPEEEIYVNCNKNITCLQNPQKENCTFDGWYYDNNAKETKFTNDTKVSSDLKIYAKWQGDKKNFNGEGTKEKPYEITSIDDINKLSQLVNEGNTDYISKNYTLTKDITFDKSTFTSIGSEDNPFDGTFNGNGHILSGININCEDKGQGVFGFTTSNALIENLASLNESIEGLKNIGGIVGNNKGKIASCYTSGNIEGESTLGGICGVNSSGSIKDCYSMCNIKSSKNKVTIGGICGKNDNGDETTLNCYYLKDCACGGVNSEDIDGVKSVTKDELSSGKTSYLLNTNNESSDNTKLWSIDPDNHYPVLANSNMLGICKVTSKDEESKVIYTNCNGKIKLPQIDDEDNKKFAGFFKDENLKDEAKDSDVYSEDSILYSKWEEIQKEEEKYTVRFLDYDGKEIGISQEVAKGESAIAPDTPIREGYTFVKWDDNFTNITKNLDITAIYENNKEENQKEEQKEDQKEEQKEDQKEEQKEEQKEDQKEEQKEDTKEDPSQQKISDASKTPEASKTSGNNNQSSSKEDNEKNNTFDSSNIFMILMINFISIFILFKQKIKKNL